MSGALWLRLRPASLRIRLLVVIEVACVTLGAYSRAPWPAMPVRADSGVAAAPPTLPGRLAYLSHGDVWLLSGSAVRPLTDGGGFTSVRWSPGGTVLLVTGPSGGRVLRSDGTLDDGLIGAWAPDDSVVAEATPDGGAALASPQTGALNPLIGSQPGTTWEPVAWSADGQSLALIRRTVDARGVPTMESAWVVGRDGQGLRELMPAGDTWPRPVGWSPDGRWLAVYLGPAEACVSCRVDGQPLVLVSADGARIVTVGDVLRPDWLTWAPDSTYLVAVVGGGRETYRNKRIVRLDLPSGRATELAGSDARTAIQPAVAPDGRAMAFTTAPALIGEDFTALDAAHGYPAKVIGGRSIAIIAPANSALQPAISAGSGWTDEAPRWLSPDLLLFVRWRSDDWRTTSQQQLWLVDLTTGDQRPLVDDLGEPSSAVGFYGQLGWSALFSWQP